MRLSSTYAKDLNNVTSLNLIMRDIVQKKLEGVVDDEGFDNYYSSEGNSREAEETEDSSKAAVVRSYREANLKRMSREEKLEWLAGYIDGDGSITTLWRKDRGGRWHRNVYVASVDFSAVQVVNELMAELGIFGRVYERGANKRLYYSWNIQDRRNLKRFVWLFANRFCTSTRVGQLAILADSLDLDVEISTGETSLPWVAGFFEAEGCITCSVVKERGTKLVLVSITQRDKDILSKVSDILKGYSIGRLYISRAKNRSTWRLDIAGAVNVRGFINLIGGYVLSDKKIMQVLRAVDFIKNWNVGYKETSWLPEICETALELRRRGMSCSRIARVMNAKFGISVSGNAVWVKLKRLKGVNSGEVE